jgi:hypothetical protein
MTMKYQAIAELSQAGVEAAIARNEPNELAVAVLSAALYAEDAAWAEGVCVRLAGHEHEGVRGNAVLGFGHIARIHRRLDAHRVKPLIEAALEDESECVRGQAEAAADDVELFLRWRLNRRR